MKPLIAYFSASGTTRNAAIKLKEELNGDLYEIEPQEKYCAADLNWNDNNSRSSIEIKDSALRPAIVEPSSDVNKYDTVYVGFPIWWGIAPNVVKTFLDKIDLNGKKIITFCTSGGSTLPPATEDLKKTYPMADIESGKRL